MVENFLHAYFVIKAPKSETIIYDAKFKIPDVCGPGKAQYLKRKKVSIERCEAFLNDNLEESLDRQKQVGVLEHISPHTSSDLMLILQ